MTTPELDRLRKIEEPVKRRAVFVGLLGKLLADEGIAPPFIVGGLAVEIYTAGDYMTSDIDLKGPREPLDRLLRERFGFVKAGGSYANAALGLYVDWLGEAPEAPHEDASRAQTVNLGGGLSLRVIGVEDIVIDRLTAAKHWRDQDSRLWAGEIIETVLAAGYVLDVEYLKRRAAAEDVADELAAVLTESRGGDAV